MTELFTQRTGRLRIDESTLEHGVEEQLEQGVVVRQVVERAIEADHARPFGKPLACFTYRLREPFR